MATTHNSSNINRSSPSVIVVVINFITTWLHNGLIVIFIPAELTLMADQKLVSLCNLRGHHQLLQQVSVETSEAVAAAADVAAAVVAAAAAGLGISTRIRDVTKV